MQRRIISFRQDEEGFWIADLECGHSQHMRHKPPFIERPWVTTIAGRQDKLGAEIQCWLCDEGTGGRRP